MILATVEVVDIMRSAQILDIRLRPIRFARLEWDVYTHTPYKI